MKRLKSLLAGLALGGLLGLLFAPKKGSEFRKDLKQDIADGNYGLNAFKDEFVAMGKDVGGFTSEVAKHKDVQEYLMKGKAVAKDVQKKASTWLEANYGITEADLKKARKQIQKNARKAKGAAKKAFSKARSVVKKVREQK